MKTTDNPQIELAFNYVCHTNKNIFLTGKAGTGKTTFLHRIRKETNKRLAVVAPTGVAAINAKGVTIHSLFQLPFGPIIPGQPSDEMKKRRFSSKKIKLIKSLDLLVIDEISMVRADVLDAIDYVLRRYRDRYQLFGGVQLLMIGDLHQLPPVIKPQEWELLRPHYDTVYFFGSQALKQTDAVTIELQHIYRQSDSVFIDLLNKVRDNSMTEAVLVKLNSRYQEDFKPTDEEGYITLTSHNNTAQKINVEKLKSIEGKSFHFRAAIKDNFPAHSYPTEVNLAFKIGAQVMFVKNDISHEKLFYNGKIGRITKIDFDEIYVRCPGERQDIIVLRTEWKNMKYTLNEKTKEVTEETLGTFTQHPLKLAWAITIHKSQGLTFEKVIIDAEAAFAHGQVYVALSRCKSFEGIVLRSKIGTTAVKTDTVVRNYTEASLQNQPGAAEFQQAKKEFQQDLLKDLFNFKPLKNGFDQLRRAILENESSLQGSIEAESAILLKQAKDFVLPFGEKFTRQLQTYFQEDKMPEQHEELKERLQKACAYFLPKIQEDLLPGLVAMEVITDNQGVEKKVTEKIDDLKKELLIKKACFTTTSNAFSTTSYIKAKLNADLDFQKTTTSKSKSSAPKKTPKDIAHPELYNILSQWRADMADDQEVKRFQIISTKSLLEIAEVRPTSSANLKKIHGLGKIRIEKYGKALIHMVVEYSAKHKLDTDQLQLATGKKPTEPKPKKPETKSVTLDLYQKGKSVEEIAKERGLVTSTVEGHLSHYVALGEIDVLQFIDQKKLDTLVAYFDKAETSSFSEALQKLGTGYGYGDLRMALAYMKSLEEE